MSPDQIRELRERLNLSQAQLGQVLGVDRTQVWRWENGMAEPDSYRDGALREIKKKADQKETDEFVKGLIANAAVAVGTYLFLEWLFGE